MYRRRCIVYIELAKPAAADGGDDGDVMFWAEFYRFYRNTHFKCSTNWPKANWPWHTKVDSELGTSLICHIEANKQKNIAWNIFMRSIIHQFPFTARNAFKFSRKSANILMIRWWNKLNCSVPNKWVIMECKDQIIKWVIRHSDSLSAISHNHHTKYPS